VRAGEALGVRDGAGLGDHLPPVLVVDQHPQAPAHDGVIVGDHHVARELTGARYAALGVLDERREGLERASSRRASTRTRTVRSATSGADAACSAC
jgi:hypothetical protein